MKRTCYEIFKVHHSRSLSENVVWLKFDLKQVLTNVRGSFSFICGFIYMSPEGSSIHTQENRFHIIENEMAEYKDNYPEHKFIVGGDFNTYTNTNPVLYSLTQHLMSLMTIAILKTRFYQEGQILILGIRIHMDNHY